MSKAAAQAVKVSAQARAKVRAKARAKVLLSAKARPPPPSPSAPSAHKQMTSLCSFTHLSLCLRAKPSKQETNEVRASRRRQRASRSYDRGPPGPTTEGLEVLAFQLANPCNSLATLLRLVVGCRRGHRESSLALSLARSLALSLARSLYGCTRRSLLVR